MSKFLIFVLCIVALIAGVIVYNKVIHPPFAAPAGGGAGKNKTVQVNGFIVHPSRLDNTIISSGTLLASEQIDLTPQVSGTITSLNIAEGTHVAKGTLLMQLFNEDLQAQLRKLQVQRENAEQNEGRLKQLLAMNGVGQQDYDNALAGLKEIMADIDNIRAQIAKSEIHAPFDGIVGLKNVSIGAFVTPATIIASLQKIDPLKLDFSVPEKYASQIKKGDDVRFTIAGTEESYAAAVFAIEPRIDTDTRTIKVRATVRNPNAKLLPGAFAKVEVALQSNDNALMVPSQCVIPDLRGSKVIVSKGGVAQFKAVETGIRGDTLIQITSGIAVGDTIVTTGLLSVKPNMNLKIRSIER